MILFVITQPKSWLARATRWRWLRWLGSIAYGVYLVHLLPFVLIFRGIWPRTDLHLHGWSSIGAMALALAATLAICQLSWHYFEKPLVQIDHRHELRIRLLGLPGVYLLWRSYLALTYDDDVLRTDFRVVDVFA
jgi:peptidoglycan/LPS O-acetylase OafA/YrhL